jgi:hypothetical protein
MDSLGDEVEDEVEVEKRTKARPVNPGRLQKRLKWDVFSSKTFALAKAENVLPMR